MGALSRISIFAIPASNARPGKWPLAGPRDTADSHWVPTDSPLASPFASETRPMNFTSDNAYGASPEILAALAAANAGATASYGADAITAELRVRMEALFEHD